MIGRLVLLAFLLCAVLPHASAKQLGKIGPTYNISEQNFLAFIQEKLRQKERSGELARLQEEGKRRAAATIQNPPPVRGLSAAQSTRTYYYDPTYTLDRNVFDGDGRLIFPAGTSANPLAVVSLNEQLLFFDGRDPAQVAQARAMMDAAPLPVKPILVGGSYMALMKEWQRPVFYDQWGRLTAKLGIKHVPALVTQEGLRLRIDELAVAAR